MNGTQSGPTIDNLDSFIDELIEKKQAQGQTAEPQERDALHTTLMDQLGIFMLESTYQELSEEQQQEFKKLFDEKKALTELHEYAVSHIDNYDDFMSGVMVDFEEAYLSGELDSSEDPTKAAYINDLIDRKNFANLTPEFRKEVFEDATKKLDEYIMARSLAQFSEEEIAQFKKLLEEKKTQGELQQFAMDHITDYPTFLDDTLSQFEEAYLS